MPCVHAFHHRHARILSQALVELRATDVERDHPAGAVLEQDVGKPARGRADVDGIAARRIHAELLERVRELLSPAGHEPRRLQHLERRGLVDLLPRLVETRHPPGHHERLRLRARDSARPRSTRRTSSRFRIGP